TGSHRPHRGRPRTALPPVRGGLRAPGLPPPRFSSGPRTHPDHLLGHGEPIMIGTLIHHLTTMPAWLALVVIFAVPALEASAFVGVLLGYLGGNSWQHLSHLASGAGLAVLGVVVLGAIGGHLLRRRRSRRAERARAAADAPAAQEEAGAVAR